MIEAGRHTVFLSLGSNLGNKKGKLEEAIRLIAEEIGSLSAISSFYETLPWGYESDNTFLNATVQVETDLAPQELLQKTQAIEQLLGRSTKTIESYQDRPIDIDILFYDDRIVNTPILQVPHPLLHLRTFVLEPFAEIAPTFTHPLLGLTIEELLERAKESNGSLL